MTKQNFIIIVSISACVLITHSCTSFHASTLTIETDSITAGQLASFNNTIPSDTLSEPLSKDFFNQWKELSNYYAAMRSNPVIDSIYQRAFEHYLPDSIRYKYFVLLPTVNVSIYNRSYDTIDGAHLNDLKYKSFLKSKGSFIPHLNTGREVLYLFDNIEKSLSQYLGGLSVTAEDIDKEHVKDLRNYIEVWYGHWGGYWELATMPDIYSLCVFNNGVLVFLRYSWNSGIDVFLPNESQEFIEVSYWIE